MISTTTPLRILHVMVGITETNGQYNQHCLPLADDYDISICTYFTPQIPPAASLRVHAGDNSLKGFFRAVKAALSQQPDVVHVHAPITGFLYLLANLFSRGWMAKSVYTVRNSYMSYKWRNRLLMLPIFLSYGRLVMCSQACFESLPWHLRWLAQRKTDIVSNSVDLDRIDRTLSADRQACTNKPFRVVTVGRLIGIKNPFTLLNAFDAAGAAKSELLYIGEGNLRPQLEEASRRLDRQRQVSLTGLIPRDEVFRNIVAADLFVSASRGEGLPVAVLEAMGCGRPVVLSDIPPHREIADGVDFIPLIPEDDVEGFAREIGRFQEMSDAQRTAVGAQCRRLVQQRYGLQTMLENYERAYERTIQRQHTAVEPC